MERNKLTYVIIIVLLYLYCCTCIIIYYYLLILLYLHCYYICYCCCYNTGYTLPTQQQQNYCSYYPLHRNETSWSLMTKSSSYRINCLFLKTHQPYGEARVPENYSRATLLLRHPYDSSFVSFKR